MALAALQREPENAYRHNRLAWALLGDGRRGGRGRAGGPDGGAPGSAGGRLPDHVRDGDEAAGPHRPGPAGAARRARRSSRTTRSPSTSWPRSTWCTATRSRWPGWRAGASGLAGALRADPRQQASRFMLDVALRRFLVYTAILLAVLAYVGWRVTEFSVGGARVAGRRGRAGPARRSRPTSWLGWTGSLRAYLMTVLTQGRQRIAAIGAARLPRAAARRDRRAGRLAALAARGGRAGRLRGAAADRLGLQRARPLGRRERAARPDERRCSGGWSCCCLVAAIVLELAAARPAALVAVVVALVWWLRPRCAWSCSSSGGVARARSGFGGIRS